MTTSVDDRPRRKREVHGTGVSFSGDEGTHYYVKGKEVSKEEFETKTGSKVGIDWSDPGDRKIGLMVIGIFSFVFFCLIGIPSMEYILNQHTSQNTGSTTSSVVQNTHSSSSPYAVIFSGSTQPTYDNMANYPRILVIGNNAYTMGDASDNYVASKKIPLVSDTSNQDTYITAHGLNRVCCDDQAIIVLRTS